MRLPCSGFQCSHSQLPSHNNISINHVSTTCILCSFCPHALSQYKIGTQNSENAPLLSLALFLLTPLIRGAQTLRRHSSTSGSRSADSSDAMLGAIVALVGRFHIPDVCFEGVAAATNAHFGEVADCVFGFGEACLKSIHQYFVDCWHSFEMMGNLMG